MQHVLRVTQEGVEPPPATERREGGQTDILVTWKCSNRCPLMRTSLQHGADAASSRTRPEFATILRRTCGDVETYIRHFATSLRAIAGRPARRFPAEARRRSSVPLYLSPQSWSRSSVSVSGAHEIPPHLKFWLFRFYFRVFHERVYGVYASSSHEPALLHGAPDQPGFDRGLLSVDVLLLLQPDPRKRVLILDTFESSKVFLELRLFASLPPSSKWR